MTLPRDLQWPVSRRVRRPGPFAPADPKAERELCERIEGFFMRRLGAPVALMPSGRAAIAAVLDYLGAGRGDLVFAPRWSSACVWSAIGRTSNPTASFSPRPKFVIAVHKWGHRHGASHLSGVEVIEDSIDSVFVDGTDLFPLGGSFEVISLPKVTGAYCGGIVVTTDRSFLRQAAELRRRGCAYGRRLSRLKYERHFGRGEFLGAIDALELENRSLDINALRHIAACVPDLDRNASVIQQRLSAASNLIGAAARVRGRGGRLPSVLPLPVRRYSLRGTASLEQRHFDLSRRLERDLAEPCWVLPLHFGVSEPFFRRALATLKRKPAR